MRCQICGRETDKLYEMKIYAVCNSCYKRIIMYLEGTCDICKTRKNRLHLAIGNRDVCYMLCTPCYQSFKNRRWAQENWEDEGEFTDIEELFEL